jgi:TPR repeat protein
VPPEHESDFYTWLAETSDAFGTTAEERREAAFRAGVTYHDGRRVATDHAEAARWWRQAALAGQREAQYHLGRVYAEGRTVARDDREARYWLEQAARQGHAGAQFALAVLYQYGGEGLQPDDIEAYRWYGEAAQQGHALAEESRRMLEDVLRRERMGPPQPE